MNQEYKQSWIDALRSGDYRQGKMHLFCKGAGTYCCLGVLASLIVDSDDQINGGYLTKSMMQLAEVDDEVQYKLAKMNDSDGLSFEEIADWIEENL